MHGTDDVATLNDTAISKSSPASWHIDGVHKFESRDEQIGNKRDDFKIRTALSKAGEVMAGNGERNVAMNKYPKDETL